MDWTKAHSVETKITRLTRRLASPARCCHDISHLERMSYWPIQL